MPEARFLKVFPCAVSGAAIHDYDLGRRRALFQQTRDEPVDFSKLVQNSGNDAYGRHDWHPLALSSRIREFIITTRLALDLAPRDMNILVLFSHKWKGGRAGGAETYTIELVKGLSAKGHRIVLVTDAIKSANISRIEESLAAHYELSFQTINPFRRLKELQEITSRHGTDIVHAQHRTAGYYAEFLCRRRQVPYVVTVHDPWHATPLKSLHSRAFRNIIAVSEFLRQILIRQFRVPPERVKTIHNGVDPARFEHVDSHDAALFRERLQVKPGDVVMTQIARMSRVKGHYDLIEALQTLPSDLPYRCWMVGEGPERKNLEKLIASNALRERVTVCGFQPDIPAVLRASDFLVLPSHREGLPLTIVESMLSNVPVLAARTAGIPEMITHQIDGMLFDAGDIHALARGIEALVTDYELRLRLAKEGYRTAVERFLLKKMIDETEAHYQQIINRAKVPAPGVQSQIQDSDTLAQQ
jgi:glycosyltransferase involved in cell wall biosynthesis